MSCPHGNPIGGCDTCDEVDAAFEAGKRSALAEQPAQQQEPVKACVTGQCPCKSECDSAQCCLYTSPPAQRTFVGLTDEEIDLLEDLYAPPVHPDFVNDADHCTELIRHVEAKLKEKNA